MVMLLSFSLPRRDRCSPPLRAVCCGYSSNSLPILSHLLLESPIERKSLPTQSLPFFFSFFQRCQRRHFHLTSCMTSYSFIAPLFLSISWSHISYLSPYSCLYAPHMILSQLLAFSSNHRPILHRLIEFLSDKSVFLCSFPNQNIPSHLHCVKHLIRHDFRLAFHVICHQVASFSSTFLMLGKLSSVVFSTFSLQPLFPSRVFLPVKVLLSLHRGFFSDVSHFEIHKHF